MRRKPNIFVSQRGFALVVTLSLMILLTVIAVGLLSLASISLRSSSNSGSQMTARANARLALMQAIGELQKYAGPDQRVTSSSALFDSSVERNWTGVWSTENRDSKPVWLVSGNDSRNVGDLDSLTSYPASYVEPQANLVENKDGYLISKSKTSNPADSVKVPIVDVYKNSNSKVGRYAWWVSDEGAKARVDVKAPDGTQGTATERLARAQISAEPNMEQVDPTLGPLSDPGSALYVNKDSIVSLQTIAVAVGDSAISGKYEHDLTTGGYGLPVNVIDGGTKTDLSVLFDTSQEPNSTLQNQYFGAKATKAAGYYDFPAVSKTDKFFIDSELSGGGSRPVGPNWGILYNYARQWKFINGNTMALNTMKPNIQSEIGENRWAPYSAHKNGNWGSDVQHKTSAVAPVISFLQMGFRMRANPQLKTIPNTNPPVMGHQLQLEVKPVIGIWNPYNVKISSKTYTVVWWLFPYIRIAANTAPNIPGYPVKWIRSEIFLRDAWIDQFHGNDTAFKMQTESVDLEPGEVRLFSVSGEANLEEFNKLKPSWNEDGAFVFDLTHSFGEDIKSGTKLVKGDPYIVPPGSRVWFGDAYLDDAMSGRGRDYNPGNLVDGEAATKLWFHSGSGNSIHRIADLWPVAPRADTKTTYDLPERIISLFNRTGGKQLGDRSIEELAISPTHLGTWRFHSRTSSQAAGGTAKYGSQRMRNWVDSNPRFGAANPAWDGSMIDASKAEGFHFISPFIGGKMTGTIPTGYAAGPDGRGKVAEGQSEADSTPEADISGRYRGFAGYSNDSLDGETHVPVFDVPRAPLVSLGQLQHAGLSRYSYEPAYPFGNSYANVRIPLGQTVVEDFGGIAKFKMTDTSYELNEALWDRYFFSTIGADYKSPNGTGNIDTLFPADKLASGDIQLTNTRYRYVPFGENLPVSKIIKRSDKTGPNAIAAHIAIDGAFNVNSTSLVAWKAILSSMENLDFPVLSEDGKSESWEQNGGIRFPRFGHVMQKTGWSADSGTGGGPEFWSGYREISGDELDVLAQSIVTEIRERSKDRGPFRSLADFVNRDPQASDVNHQRKGALQAAIDKAINVKTIGPVGLQAQAPKGQWFQKDVITNTTDGKVSQSAGSAGYLMQSDVLQALAPVLEVRSDYFRIRTMGQAVDASGKVTATAVCEAFVQRVADFVNPRDEPHLAADQLQSNDNKSFGRRFEIVSFKWLNPSDI